jgi:flagellar motor switch protein FliM
MVVTRFGIAGAHAKPVFVDILYPISALKPHGPTLTGKVVGRGAAPDPAWRNRLTRAVMGVRFPVRSVLAEPTIKLSQLLELKVGDVIPISFADDVPVMVNQDRLGIGTVGTANGHAAIRLNNLATNDEEDQG